MPSVISSGKWSHVKLKRRDLGAAGEGGAVVTQDGDVASRLRRLRNHGSVEKYIHEELGYNYRLDGVQGAVLSVKLRHLAEWTERRRRVAAGYDVRLGEVKKPAVIPNSRSAYHIYPILVDERDAVRSELRTQGVETNVHYPVPCHLQPGYTALGYGRGAFPNAEYLANHELSLPIFPEMSEEQIFYVCDRLMKML